MNELIPIMMLGANLNPDAQNQDISNSNTPEYFEKVIKTTMGYKFNSGAELNYFDKIFENKDVIIYQLK